MQNHRKEINETKNLQNEIAEATRRGHEASRTGEENPYGLPMVAELTVKGRALLTIPRKELLCHLAWLEGQRADMLETMRGLITNPELHANAQVTYGEQPTYDEQLPLDQVMQNNL